jgi:hypothetical protein
MRATTLTLIRERIAVLLFDLSDVCQRLYMRRFDKRYARILAAGAGIDDMPFDRVDRFLTRWERRFEEAGARIVGVPTLAEQLAAEINAQEQRELALELLSADELERGKQWYRETLSELAYELFGEEQPRDQRGMFIPIEHAPVSREVHVWADDGGALHPED